MCSPVPQVVAHLNWKKKTPLPRAHFGPVEEPFYPADEILGIVGANIRIPFDSREVLSRSASPFSHERSCAFLYFAFDEVWCCQSGERERERDGRRAKEGERVCFLAELGLTPPAQGHRPHCRRLALQRIQASLR